MKTALDRDAIRRNSPSYRICMTIRDAVALGYMHPKS
jgi:hypothetical protein